jgi:hypothetical protein
MMSTEETKQREAVRRTALDYIDGWYAGDAERMRRSLHPDLAKRIQRPDADGRLRVENMGADDLVGWTEKGTGTTDAVRRDDVHVQDVFGRAASVRVDAGRWVDFLHLVETEAGWQIVNVLWELRIPAEA